MKRDDTAARDREADHWDSGRLRRQTADLFAVPCRRCFPEAPPTSTKENHD